MKSILENKYVLYVIAFISGTSLLNLVLTKKINAVIFFIAIVLLDKIDMPAPNKLIKQEITNDKIITLK